jgi:hypothetical protein
VSNVFSPISQKVYDIVHASETPLTMKEIRLKFYANTENKGVPRCKIYNGVHNNVLTGRFVKMFQKDPLTNKETFTYTTI